MAAYGTDVDALSNTEVAPYADNYFQYDDQLRVTEEIGEKRCQEPFFRKGS